MLERSVYKLLRRHGSGLSEFEMIKLLQNDELLPLDGFQDSLRLFQLHFTLFHALYRLRQRLWEKESWHLKIDPLQICLETYQKSEPGLTREDPLQKYYLDTSHLNNATREEVEELLSNFYKRFLPDEKRRAALERLGLPAHADDATIKSTYRELVKIHHPDRGGKTARLQEINEAVSLLLT